MQGSAKEWLGKEFGDRGLSINSATTINQQSIHSLSFIQPSLPSQHPSPPARRAMPSLPPSSNPAHSPRPRRSSRPLALTTTPSAQHTVQSTHNASTTSSNHSSYFPALSGPYRTPGGSLGRGWQRQVAVDLHAHLYAGEHDRAGRRDIREFIESVYAAEAGKLNAGTPPAPTQAEP